MNLTHNDIHPEQIVVTDDGSIKLIDVSVFSKGTYLDQATASMKNSYLSPEELSMIKTKSKGKYNIYKAEVYSLGMTLLHTASLTSSSRFYNFTDKSIN